MLVHIELWSNRVRFQLSQHVRNFQSNGIISQSCHFSKPFTLEKRLCSRNNMLGWVQLVTRTGLVRVTRNQLVQHHLDSTLSSREKTFSFVSFSANVLQFLLQHFIEMPFLESRRRRKTSSSRVIIHCCQPISFFNWLLCTILYKTLVSFSLALPFNHDLFYSIISFFLNKWLSNRNVLIFFSGPIDFFSSFTEHCFISFVSLRHI